MISEKENNIAQKAINNAYNKIIPFKNIFLFTFFFGLFDHMFMFTNKLPNHDDVSSLFTKGTTIGSGRWAIGVFSFFFPNYSMPWVYGVFTVAVVSVCVCLILKIFEIDGKISKYIFSAIVVSSMFVVNTLAFMYTSVLYATAFLLSILSVLFWTKKGVSYKIASVCCLVFSLGIYQAFIAVTASFLLLLLIKDIINKNDSVKNTILNGAYYLLLLIISLVFYYFITKGIQLLASKPFNEYSKEAMTSGKNIFERIGSAYSMFILEFFHAENYLAPSLISKICHLAVLIVSLIGVALSFKKLDSVSKRITLCLIVLMLPIAIYCLAIFVNRSFVRAIMLWSYVSVYIFFFIILKSVTGDHLSKRFAAAKNITALLLSIIVLSNIYSANAVYLRLNVKYEHVHSYYTTLITRIQMTEGYDEDTKLLFIGDKSASDTLYPYGEFDRLGIDINEMDFYVDLYSYKKFIKYYIGFNAKFEKDDVEEQIINEVIKTEEYKKMGIYPYENSVKKINDYMVVRFS